MAPAPVSKFKFSCDVGGVGTGLRNVHRCLEYVRRADIIIILDLDNGRGLWL